MSLETGFLLSLGLICSFAVGMTAFIIWHGNREEDEQHEQQ